MTKPQRLFDCLPILMEDAPNETLVGAKEGGEWREYSTREVTDIVEKLSAGLLSLGISPNDMSVENRDKIAVISKNRPEWLFLDLAVQRLVLSWYLFIQQCTSMILPLYLMTLALRWSL